MRHDSFLMAFVRNCAYAIAGAVTMLVFVKMLVWMFGQAIGVAIAWLFLILGWIAYITFSSCKEG